MDVYNVIIVGGGPAGLAAAVYNARADLSPFVIAGAPSGGQLMLTSDVENYPGFESILGPDLIAKMRAHAQKFGTSFIDENVKSVDFSKRPFKLTTSDGKEHLSKSVLIATGASVLWLGLESEQRLRGHGVSACATCDGFFFRNKIVAVVGGGDTAMEEALFLTKFATEVFIIHRRDSFRASKIMQQRVLNNPKIKVLWNTQIEEVLGQDKVEGLKVKSDNNVTIQQLSNESTLRVDGLFLAIGHKPDTDFLKDSGVFLDRKGYVKTSGWVAWENQKNPNNKIQMPNVNFNYQYITSVPGVFAAGDCVDYVYRQAGTAVGMGIAAALEVERYLEEI